MIIPIETIKQVITALLIAVALVLLYHSQYGRPLRLKVKELRIRYHGRPAAFRRAQRKALRLSRKTNKRYYVYFLNMRYRVMHRDDVRAHKRTGHFRHHVNVSNMKPIEFFDTQKHDLCL